MAIAKQYSDGAFFQLKVSDWMGKEELTKVINSPGYHFLVFAAKWCGYCMRFLTIAKSYNSSIDTELELIDTDEPDESLWDEFSIRIVPTIIVMKDGKQVFRKDGRSMAGLGESDLEQGLDVLASSTKQ